MDKRCDVESMEIKKIMAIQNVSGFEATRIVRGSYQEEHEINEWKEYEDTMSRDEGWNEVELGRNKKKLTYIYADKVKQGFKKYNENKVQEKDSERDTRGYREKDRREVDKDRIRSSCECQISRKVEQRRERKSSVRRMVSRIEEDNGRELVLEKEKVDTLYKMFIIKWKKKLKD